MATEFLSDEIYPYPPVHIHAIENRRYGRNGTGFILGQDKKLECCVKEEIEYLLNSSQDTIVLIDTTGLYTDFALSMGASILSFAQPEGYYINPFYVVMQKENEWQLLREKTDFLIALFESVICDATGFNIAQKTVMEYCIKKVYEPFLQSYDPILKIYDYDLLPCLNDLFSVLIIQRSGKIKELAEHMQCRKNDIIRVLTAKRTGESHSKFKVYNLKNVPHCQKTTAILSILDKCRQKTDEQPNKDVYTWIYIDEIHLIFSKPFAANFFETYYINTTSYKCITTGITNKPEIFYKNIHADKLLHDAHYVVLLFSSRILRAQILSFISASSEYSECKDNESNCGLIYNKINVLPFHV